MSIDFRIRDFFYPRRIWSLHRRFHRNQYLPPHQLEEYQQGLLRQTLEHAVASVPYYAEIAADRGIDINRLDPREALQQFPLLTKPQLRDSLADLTARDARRFRPKLYRTSGTSGEPVAFYLDEPSNALEFVYYWRHWSWGGYRLGDPFAEISSHFFLSHPELSERLFYHQPLLRRLLLNANRISLENGHRYANALHRYRPRFLKGLASNLYALSSVLQRNSCNDVSFKAAFSTGEALTPAYRETIEGALNTRVLDSYGHMERTVAISQCPEGGYHVNSDYGLLEFAQVRDLKGTLMARAVGTSLHNRSTPLIRYDIGDEIELFASPETCPCGRTLPLVKAIHGRSEDIIYTPDGRFVTTLFIIPEMVDDIESAQFIQTEKDRLLVLVVPQPGWNEEDEERLRALITDTVGPEMQLTVKRVSRERIHVDPSGKVRPVIGLSNNVET